MSTPLNHLPLKTQHSNEENNDIQDPMVQDVLNEFQEELNSTRQHNSVQLQSQHSQIAQQDQVQPQMSHQNIPVHPQQRQYVQQPPTYFPPPSNKYTISYNDNNKFPYNYIDVELMKKIAIIVIITMLIFCTDGFMMLYSKLPDYISDVSLRFDIYVRSIALFVILYVLGFMDYI